MRKPIEVGQEVEILRGAYAGQKGEVAAKGRGQYDVKVADGSIRYLGRDDIK